MFAPDGSRLGSWVPVPGGLPVGIAALPDGGFVFGDATSGQVQIVPLSAIDGLFQ